MDFHFLFTLGIILICNRNVVMYCTVLSVLHIRSEDYNNVCFQLIINCLLVLHDFLLHFFMHSFLHLNLSPDN